MRYSVPVRCLGQRVEVRHEVDAETIELRWAAEVVATHRIASAEVREVWDGAHFAQAQEAALGRNRRHHLRLVPPEAPAASVQERLELGDGDYDVEPLDLGRYDIDRPHPTIDAAPTDASTGHTEDGSGVGGQP